MNALILFVFRNKVVYIAMKNFFWIRKSASKQAIRNLVIVKEPQNPPGAGSIRFFGVIFVWSGLNPDHKAREMAKISTKVGR